MRRDEPTEGRRRTWSSDQQYAAIGGIDDEKIVDLAREFTSHGRKAVSEMRRGACKHPNGYYNSAAVLNLNLLVSNTSWTGGLAVGSGGYNLRKGRYDVIAVPTGSTGGVKLPREEVRYEDSND